MLGSTALIIWGSATVIAALGVLRAGLNPRDRIAALSLCSAIAAGATGGFTVSDTVGLFTSAALLFMVALLTGYEG